MKNLHQQVLELLPQCIEDRRWLHRHAELSFREYKTADYLEQALCELEGLELSRPTPTSVMAVLRTGRPGRCLPLRAALCEMTRCPSARKTSWIIAPAMKA